MSLSRSTFKAALTRFRGVTGSQLRLNVLSGFGANLLTILITVLGYRIYLTYLGYERFGVWLILSTVLIMVQLSNFGISPAVLKFVAEDFARADLPGVYRYITSAVAVLSAAGAVIIGAICLLRQPITSLFGLTGDRYQSVYEMLPYVGALSVYVIIVDTLNSALAGLGRYDLVNYTQVASQAINLAITVSGLKVGWGLWSFVAGSAVSYVFLNVSSILLIWKLTRPGRLRDCGIDRVRLKRVLGYGGWVFGGSVIAVLVNPINRILISRFIGVAAIPVFDIANTSTARIRNVLEVVFRPLMPDLSKLQASGPKAVLERLVSAERTGTRFILYWGSALHLAVFGLAGWALQIWLGPRFSPALPAVFRIILVGTYSSLWAVPAYYTLLGLGRSTQILISFSIQLILNVTVIYLFVIFGHAATLSLNDVAIAASAGLLGSTLYLLWEFRKLRAEIENNARLEVSNPQG